MAKRLKRMTAEERQDLVAYLDGELDPQRAEEIEQTLADSVVARRDVDLLARTFDLLDLLPEAKASDDFSERTLSSIRLAEEQTPLSAREWFQRARRGFVLASAVAALALLGAVGFLSTNRWIPRESERLVRDLEVVQNLDAYREAGSVEFLQELRNSGFLDRVRREEAEEGSDDR